MRYKLLYFLLVITLSSVACADAPTPIVSPQPEPTDTEVEVDEVKTMALEYSKPQGISNCRVYIGFVEHEEENGEYLLEPVIEIERVSLDGFRLHADYAQFYWFNSIDESSYFPMNEPQPNTVLSLVSVRISDSEVNPDPNDLASYESEGVFLQDQRLEFSDSINTVGAMEDFIDLLIGVIAGDLDFEEHREDLNMLIFSKGTGLHNPGTPSAHPHDFTCRNLVPQRVFEKTFKLNGAVHEH